MPRNFKDFAELKEFQTKVLKLPELNVLIPDALLYEVLAIPRLSAGSSQLGTSAIQGFDSLPRSLTLRYKRSPF